MNKSNLKRINRQRRVIMLSAAAIPAVAMQYARADEKAGMVEENDKLAMQLGYRKDATTVDTTKFPKRDGDEGAKQFCKNCQFFEAAGSKESPCVIFGGKKVMATGWCNSWFARA